MIWNPWREIKRLRADNEMLSKEVALLARGAERWQEAFSKIIDEEKPTSNATVKRMARMAREALGK